MAAVSCIGADGEGFELKRALARFGVDMRALVERPDRFTPTYTKPMLKDGRGAPYELNRLDTKNRRPLPRAVEREICAALTALAPSLDGIYVADQVAEAECGVVTGRVRDTLARLGRRFPHKVIFVDSRHRVDAFRRVIIKPNRHEVAAVLADDEERPSLRRLAAGARRLMERTERPVYVTLGARGCLCVTAEATVHVPTFRPSAPIDAVGAGDSFGAAAFAALCAGADPVEAGLIGNLAASLTIEQIGMTGAATRAQVKRRFRELRRQVTGGHGAPCPYHKAINLL